jgi:adenylate cyclase
VQRLKAYLLDRFEQVFVLLILLTILLINYYVPYKIAFLNFYFLPVIVAGYFLGPRRSVLGALLCILLVIVYTLLYPQLFTMPNTLQDLYLYILAWSGFLILSGAVVGKQQEKLDREIQETRRLNKMLQQRQEELNSAHLGLKDYSENLEQKVSERTKELETSKAAVETLKSKVEEALYATMDSSVVKLIIEGRLRNEKRKVSIVFSDLVGFTNYSEERSPEFVVRDLNRYLNDMEPILLNYHGHIDKYLGDGIMCEFGAPLDYENYRLLAVLAALKMQERMASMDYPWQMRIGIASGSAIMGLIGSRRQSYTSIGDVVNLAARMEKACPPGSILIDSFTLEGVSRFVDVRLKKDIAQSEVVDPKIEIELEELHHKLYETSGSQEKAELYHRIGKIHMELLEAHDAARYFEQALQIEPENVDLKVAFAEATIKKEEYDKIKVKGRKQRVAAYEVMGIRDVILDRKKIPAAFYEVYHHVEDLIKIPENVVFPVEALDGSIGHSKVVALLSYALASELGVPEKERLEILHAGYVADIGKEIIPHHLLNRMGGLSAGELAEVQKHPTEGPRILRKMGYDSEQMLRIVRHSHENFKGSGYPDGLQRDEIPLGSRIVAVADAYDALTSWRPYREQWDRNGALDELRRGVEKGLFDPQIVDTLIKILS